jgi:hypothetical protein
VHCSIIPGDATHRSSFARSVEQPILQSNPALSSTAIVRQLPVIYK